EFDVDIYNHKAGSATGSGGSITGDASISFNVTDNFAMPGTDTSGTNTTPGDAFFEILNFRGGASGTGGFIGGNASVDVEAGSIGSMTTPLAELDADILNF